MSYEFCIFILNQKLKRTISFNELLVYFGMFDILKIKDIKFDDIKEMDKKYNQFLK